MVMIKRNGDLFVEKKWTELLEKESNHEVKKGLADGDDSAILEMFRRKNENRSV